MNKNIKKFLIIIISFVILMNIIFWFFNFWLNSPKEFAKSDVPLTYTLDAVGYQNEILVNELIVTGNSKYLSLFNSKAVITINIKGQIYPRLCHLSKIKYLQISEKWLKDKHDGNSIGEITLVPIVEYIKDKPNTFEISNFDVTIQDYISTNGFGENKYIVKCYGKEKELILYQNK